MTDRWDDELDQALGELRADVPAMEQHAFAAGRARLVVAIGAPSMAAPGREPDETATIALPPDLRRRSPPLRRAAPWLAVAAAVAVVATGAVAFLPGDTAPSGGPRGTAGPSASSHVVEPSENASPGEALPPMPERPLNTTGELADDVRDVELQPGQVRYVRAARTHAGGDDGPGGTMTEELWIPYDRESDWLVRNTASGEIQARPEEDFVEDRAKGGQFDSGAIWPEDPRTVADLPRDPAGLYEWLRSESSTDLGPGNGSSMTAAQEAIGTVVSMLADVTGTIPADLRAALLRTLGYLPGLTVTPDARATDGRPAVAVGYAVDEGLYRNEILFDPATAAVIDWRNVANEPFEGFERDQVITTDLRTEAVVSRLGQRP